MCADFILPREFFELEQDSIEYTYGEGEKITHYCQWNSTAGLNYLASEANFMANITGVFTSPAGKGLIIGTVSVLIPDLLLSGNPTAALIGAGLLIATIGVVYLYAKSAQDCLDRTLTNFVNTGTNYILYRDTILFGTVDTGYGVKAW